MTKPVPICQAAEEQWADAHLGMGSSVPNAAPQVSELSPYFCP
jgi:hypothetical protein